MCNQDDIQSQKSHLYSAKAVGWNGGLPFPRSGFRILDMDPEVARFTPVTFLPSVIRECNSLPGEIVRLFRYLNICVNT